jgi:hypothetical protein
MSELKWLLLACLVCAGVERASEAPSVAQDAPKAITRPLGRLAHAALPYQGLQAVADRNAWRPIERFLRDGTYLSERVIYTDSVTGNEVWQMTVDPGVDRVAYYDLPEWNADGSLLMFNTARSSDRLWMMNADGTRLRPMPVGQSRTARDGFWSVVDPDVWWAGENDDDGSRVVAVNIRTGDRKIVARTSRRGLDLFPPHPAERHFLLARNGRNGRDCEVVVLGRDGSEQVVPIGGQFHRLRFTKAEKPQIFFNRNEPRTQWVIMPDGSGLKELPDAGVHPDWVIGGAELTYFFDGGVYAVDQDGQRRCIFKTGSGGHGGPSPDGELFVADQSSAGLFPDSIVCAFMHSAGKVWPVAYHGSRLWAHDDASKAHPDHHSTHPHPSFSPDGTKAVFSSYFGRAFTDVHVAISRYPDPPRNLMAQRHGDRVSLKWEAPRRCRELKGYAVFRRLDGDSTYALVNTALLKERECSDPVPSGKRVFYTVCAVEHSGLAGMPAGEIKAELAGEISATLDVGGGPPPATAPSQRPRLNKAVPPAPRGLAAKAIDPFHVKLTWTASSDASVQYYHVYNVPAPDAACTQAARVASPSETVAVDWGRTPGSTQHYRVTAVDWFGSESPPSEPTTVTMPNQPIVNLEFRAADGSLGNGMELLDDAGGTGSRVAAAKPGTAGRDATITWSMDILTLGEYAVWIQQLAPNPQTDRTVSVALGDQPPCKARLFGTFNKYVWWPVTENPSSTPHRFRLQAKDATLQIKLHEEGSKIAGVLITNDMTRMPTEFAGPPVSHLDLPSKGQPLAPRGETLFEEAFTNLDGWYHEGSGKILIESPGTMRLSLTGSRQGGVGCHAFCRRDFPDNIAVEFDLKVLTSNGLIITFVAMAGLNGEDMITGGLRPRTGLFKDYVGQDAAVRSYHVSVSRYNDKGRHTGTSNWRRNPGLNLMAQGTDLCREIGRWYHVRIVNNGRHCQLQVDGRLAHEFVDPGTLPTPLPTGGKIGFRAIGSDVHALVRNFRVVAMRENGDRTGTRPDSR